jgi:uncharacterized protein (TIGR00269 family)
MRQHKLALCGGCFSDWFVEQTRKNIERYEMLAPTDKVLVAVSGGKDSLALWDVLHRLGYEAEGVYIDLGIEDGGYSSLSRRRVEEFAESLDATITIVDVKATYGRSVPELVKERRGRTYCSLCGLVKRHEMNRIAYEGGFSALATGHNLDDEVATLLQNTLRWEMGYLARQAPVLPSIHPRLARKVKPLCRMTERETASYAVIQTIDYIYDECPHAARATSIFHKELLNQLETRSRGAKLSFYLNFLRARTSFEAPKVNLNACSRCGQPTASPEICAFCRLWEDGEG